MSYNRVNYNQILYNAAPEDFASLAKSVIQAHTGPHIQAVVGGDGLSFISDFIITEGPQTSVPSRFYFPDLAARIKAVKTDSKDLGASIFGFSFLDLPARIFPVEGLPDLAARINALITTDLGATILGKLAEANLAGTISGTEFVDLLGTMLGIPAPNLGAFIGTHPPADLGAVIWAPENLAAVILAVSFQDLGGSIVPFSTGDLGGSMLGIAAPNLAAFLRSFQSATLDLTGSLGPVSGPSDLTGTITPVFPSIQAVINAVGEVSDLLGIIRASASAVADIGAFLLATDNADLLATIGIIDQSSLPAILTVIGTDRFKDLSALLQSVTYSDLGASIMSLVGLANLSATISSATDTLDLGGRIVVDETFITSILTVITLVASDLGATIGNPSCAGGSSIKELSAFALPQSALNLSATIQSFIDSDLGALINSGQSFRAFDTIDITYTPFHPRPEKFRFTDTIDITYTPFRGSTLSASITATPPEANLSAVLNAAFPLLKVSPFKSRVTAIDLNSNPLDITDIALQLEGQIVEFLYVQGLGSAFVKDPNEQWRINIRSFTEVAENIFGDREVERICRLGSLETFNTLDEAVRFCINAVLGLSSQVDMGAVINATGGFKNLAASLGVSDTFSDLKSFCGRAFPSDLLSALINPGGPTDLHAFLGVVAKEDSDLSATVQGFEDGDLGASITGTL